MTHPTASPADPGPSRPTPGAMPRRQFDPVADGFGAAEAGGELPDVEAEVTAVLAQVDEIRESVGDTFSLAALERQAGLLEQAHDSLTAALDAVDRR
ncbi:hypothetical protein [Gordonia sp. NPDC058843]|uniref:hypothetical protein n=1 Tax=Gordonia sp. NPDC058843 TaxID=3346648 RepID=UPI0036BF36A2